MDKFSLKTVHLKMSSVRCQPLMILLKSHLSTLTSGLSLIALNWSTIPGWIFLRYRSTPRRSFSKPCICKGRRVCKITDFWQYQISNLFLQAPLDEQRCGQVHGGAHIHHVHAPQICKIYISLCTSVHLKVSSRFWDAGRCTLSSTPWTYW